MKFLLNGLLICLIAIILIAPIGLGALQGLNGSSQDDVGSSGGEQTDPNLTLSESEVTFNIGATKSISATTDTESAFYIFQWNTSDKNVVAVKRSEDQRVCELTAVGEGSATITVNVIDVSKFKIVDSATCEVTVIDSSIKFSASQVIISLENGNTASVSATAPDGGEISWSSSDESVVTVEGGAITAHKPGQAYVIAKSGNVEGKLLVKVYTSVFALEGVKQVGAGTSATISVSGALTEGAVWTSGDDRIATVDQNGNVTGIKPGMTTVKVSSVIDDQVSTCVIVVNGSGAEPFELVSGKKAEAAANPGTWYFLCESPQVTIGSIPTMDNGLISLDITNVGTSGANMFYLRYQTDEDGDVTYKHTLYIYSYEAEEVLIQLNGVDTYLTPGLNRIEVDFTSSSPNEKSPYQIKFKNAGRFYVLPLFEEISRVAKMTLSESYHKLTSEESQITLTAKITGIENPDVQWTSSDESVCTVADGVVTSVGEGSAIITATSGEFSEICIITVEGDEPISGEKLSSGNKSATVADPGNWFYLADGKSKVAETPVIDEDGNIYLTITNTDDEGKKFTYLRYQPETIGAKYKVTITIEFTGADGSVVDVTAGDVTSASTITLNNGTNTLEFEFTANDKNPLQLKLYDIGVYTVNVTMTQI